MTTADAALGVNRFRASQLHVVLGGAKDRRQPRRRVMTVWAVAICRAKRHSLVVRGRGRVYARAARSEVLSGRA